MSVGQPLPLPVRAWSRVGGALPERVRRGVGDRIARSTLRDDATYRGPHGFALRIDSGDAFQRAMLLDFFDPVLAAVIDEYVPSGGQVLDCGSHIGYLALLFARAVGPDGGVHCFEPDPRVAPRLRDHVASNGMRHVTVTQAAVSDRSGDDVELSLTDQLGWSSTGPHLGEAHATATVPTIAVDDYVRDNHIEPRFIKLDVEGAEGAALRGMAQTLSGGSAPLLVEWIPRRMQANGDEPQEYLDMLSEWGYRPHAPRLRGGALDLPRGTDPEVGDDVLFLKA
jgi:FkbM family methyltransferase